jgi:hypothetical protein
VKLSEPRILFLDIETAPAVVLTWLDSHYEQNVIEVLKPWFLLSFAYQWRGDEDIHYVGLNHFSRPKKTNFGLLDYSDRPLIKAAAELLEEADIVVAHNASFDVGKICGQALRYGMKPVTPYRIFCTYQAAKRQFKLSSNKLDNVAALLGVGRKLPHQGKHTWLGCLRGESEAWGTMEEYNRHDVFLLREVYHHIAPWATNHPNLSFYTRRHECPRCQHPRVVGKGRHPLMSGWKQRYKCKRCGHKFVAGPVHKS